MEVFGTVASALSVAALFNNCVDCFGYIQLGRHFGRDYEVYQLKLDIAKTRLSRWGQAVAINDDPQFATDSPNEIPLRKAKAILEQIKLLFDVLQKSSDWYKIDAVQEELELLQIQDMQLVARNVHGRLNNIVSGRQKGTSLLKKARWALYDSKNFDKLVNQVTEFIDDLEKLFPVKDARRTLVEIEIEELNDEPSLRVLQSAAAGTDSVLSEVVTKRLEKCETRNSIKGLEAEGHTVVRNGNRYAMSYDGADSASLTTNELTSVKAKDNSQIYNGNSYGRD
ncbi:prion-inhibition and propagation-domain-containing protein [Hypoxylon argillaceum]|nr:prion-inhibition and propagation-domain-containing protein [Hypoxylon argillaceum]KAI1149239.1 prion-inhibition and propagation-domain-containing protein [Nemania diffusa]